MTTTLQSRLRGHEPADLHADIVSLADVWAATLLDARVSELPEHPDADVVLHRLTACALLRDELDRYSRQLERDARAAGQTQTAIAEARGVSPQAVSARLRSESKANPVSVGIGAGD